MYHERITTVTTEVQARLESEETFDQSTARITSTSPVLIALHNTKMKAVNSREMTLHDADVSRTQSGEVGLTTVPKTLQSTTCALSPAETANVLKRKPVQKPLSATSTTSLSMDSAAKPPKSNITNESAVTVPLSISVSAVSETNYTKASPVLTGTADILPAILNAANGSKCKHYPKLKPADTSNIPHRLAFLNVKGDTITHLKMDGLCQPCYRQLVPEGFNVWLTGMTGIKRGELFPTIEDMKVTKDEVHKPMPFSVSAEETAAFQWLYEQKKPFFVDQCHMNIPFKPDALDPEMEKRRVLSVIAGLLVESAAHIITGEQGCLLDGRAIAQQAGPNISPTAVLSLNRKPASKISLHTTEDPKGSSPPGSTSTSKARGTSGGNMLRKRVVTSDAQTSTAGSGTGRHLQARLDKVSTKSENTQKEDAYTTSAEPIGRSKGHKADVLPREGGSGIKEKHSKVSSAKDIDTMPREEQGETWLSGTGAHDSSPIHTNYGKAREIDGGGPGHRVLSITQNWIQKMGTTGASLPPNPQTRPQRTTLVTERSKRDVSRQSLQTFNVSPPLPKAVVQGRLTCGPPPPLSLPFPPGSTKRAVPAAGRSSRGLPPPLYPQYPFQGTMPPVLAGGARGPPPPMQSQPTLQGKSPVARVPGGGGTKGQSSKPHSESPPHGATPVAPNPRGITRGPTSLLHPISLPQRTKSVAPVAGSGIKALPPPGRAQPPRRITKAATPGRAEGTGGPRPTLYPQPPPRRTKPAAPAPVGCTRKLPPRVRPPPPPVRTQPVQARAPLPRVRTRDQSTAPQMGLVPSTHGLPSDPDGPTPYGERDPTQPLSQTCGEKPLDDCGEHDGDKLGGERRQDPFYPHEQRTNDLLEQRSDSQCVDPPSQEYYGATSGRPWTNESRQSNQTSGDDKKIAISVAEAAAGLGVVGGAVYWLTNRDGEEGYGSAEGDFDSTMQEEEHDMTYPEDDGDPDSDVDGHSMGQYGEPAYDDPQYDKIEHPDSPEGVMTDPMSEQDDNSVDGYGDAGSGAEEEYLEHDEVEDLDAEEQDASPVWEEQHLDTEGSELEDNDYVEDPGIEEHSEGEEEDSEEETDDRSSIGDSGEEQSDGEVSSESELGDEEQQEDVGDHIEDEDIGDDEEEEGQEVGLGDESEVDGEAVVEQSDDDFDQQSEREDESSGDEVEEESEQEESEPEISEPELDVSEEGEDYAED